MEESWYITPPPCFVSGPYETKPSSLENLLIEQPGVHFFKNFQNDETEKQRLFDDKSVKSTKPKMANKQKKDIKIIPKDTENPPADDKRRLLLEVHEQRKFINACQSQINSAQKVRDLREVF